MDKKEFHVRVEDGGVTTHYTAKDTTLSVVKREATRTIVVGDKYVAAWVKRVKRANGDAIVLNPAAQLKADAHLQAVFKSHWLAAPGVKAA